MVQHCLVMGKLCIGKAIYGGGKLYLQVSGVGFQQQVTLFHFGADIHRYLGNPSANLGNDYYFRGRGNLSGYHRLCRNIVLRGLHCRNRYSFVLTCGIIVFAPASGS